MTKNVDLLKQVVEVVVGFGAGAAVGNVVRSSTPVDSRLVSKVAIRIGAFVLSRLAADASKTYTDKKIDDAAEKIQEALNPSAVETVPVAKPKSRTKTPKKAAVSE